jgi:hypothetical protein
MRRGLSILGGIGLGLALSQFPEYAQQYTQRLGGAVDELQRQIQEFDDAAAEGGLDRAQALQEYQNADSDFLAGRGQAMDGTFRRYNELSTMLARVQGATGWERLSLLPEFFDTDIGGRTFDNFKPAVPVTVEGFIYAFVGILTGYGLVSIAVTLATLPFRARWRRRAHTRI